MAERCHSSDPPQLPPSVLHVVENLDRGAVENWLVRMLRHARSRGVDLDWTFYCAVGEPGLLDDEASALGARVVYSPAPIGRKADFTRALRAELRLGQYDVLHCHHDLVSAVYLLASAGLPIRRRIIHVHNADEAVPTPSRLKQRLFREPMRRVCLTMADRIVGISAHTLDTFLDGRTRQRMRDSVHYYGLDPTPHEHAVADRRALRRELGLPPDALILLFAGRLVPEKNPAFILEVLSELRCLEPRAVAIFAGTGSLAQALLPLSGELGLENSVRLLGWRADLPEIMCSCDWFVLPHPEEPMEGFGLAVVEAQLAGLRMLLSTGVESDPLLPTASFRRLALSIGPKAWAEAAVELLRSQVPSRAAAFTALKESPMNLDRALDGLIRLHA